MAFSLRINKNEATAARRRVYFTVWDALQSTPVTTEEGGQPQVSVDGGSWTNTGIGTLTAIGNGRYYAELTQALTNVDNAVIQTRYKSANTCEFPGTTAVIDAKMEAMYAVADSVAAVLGGSGGVTFPYTLTDSTSGDPIVGATVWVTSDLAGATTIAGPGVTNAAGSVYFHLNPGTVYVWATHPGYSFTVDTEVVSA